MTSNDNEPKILRIFWLFAKKVGVKHQVIKDNIKSKTFAATCSMQAVTMLHVTELFRKIFDNFALSHYFQKLFPHFHKFCTFSEE